MAFTSEQQRAYRRSHYIRVVGRLKPGVSAQEANAELKLVAAQLAEQYPDSNKGWSAIVIPMLEYTVRDVRLVLYTLCAAVGCVLLVACANVANLLVARATSRHRELSIRAALGATRLRLVRQLLTESVLLAICGGAAGLLLARWGLKALVALAPASLPRMNNIHLDSGVLVFSLLLSVLTGLVFGVGPALIGADVHISESLKQGTRGAVGRRGRFQSALVVIELAVALMLLSVAGLLTRSFMQLTQVDLGFQPANAVAMRISLPETKYPQREQIMAFTDAVLDRLQPLPGVQSVGVTNALPIVGEWLTTLSIDERPTVAMSDKPPTNYYAVTPGYFGAIGARLVRGRLFTEQDDVQAPRVTVINETLARQYFPNEEPLGKRITLGEPAEVSREIVGIVADTKRYGVDKPTSSQTYAPFAQRPFSTFSIVLRTSGSSVALNGALRLAVYAVDKDQPIGAIEPLEQIVANTIAKQRFSMLLITIFSVVALVIATVGIYGVMAYIVLQRRSEIGIRMALGARRLDVFRLILVRGSRLIGLGIFAGLFATFLTGRTIRSMLFQTNNYDSVTLIATTVILATVALIACLFPALRAMNVDPIVPLREE